MKVKNSALRLAGAAMVAVALAPWVGASTASAAVTVYLAEKWNGTSSATTKLVPHAGCAYQEITDIAHKSQGWHFVLPGGTGLTEFTASFQKAGVVTIGLADSVNGVIVQDGKGAVVFTDGDDVLTGTLDGRAGRGTAATTGKNDMQLSHLCGDGDTPPVDECTNLSGDQGEVPPGYEQNEDGTCSLVSSPPVSSPPVDVCKNLEGNQATIPPGLVDDGSGNCVNKPAPATSTAATTSNAVTTAATTTSSAAVAPSGDTSVKGTKAGNSSSVEATSAATLPHTGSGLPIGVLLVVSLGLLLAGGALLMLPGLAFQKGSHRRH